MNITMLGTGNAMVTECYNTCFVLQDGEKSSSGRRRRWKHSASSVEAGRFCLAGYAGDFCDSQARRSSDGNCLDDPHDLPAYETGGI